MFLLIDCNNFFASVEQVFAPNTKGRPLFVLSNGNGCVIARSKEAKELGIPMSAPVFKFRDTLIKHDVVMMSPNFPLYGDISRRIMEILAQYELELEIYSIDEAFLYIEQTLDFTDLAKQIQEKIFRWTGIRVSVGIACTKTLAKVATKIAKSKESGIYEIPSSHILPHLQTFDVGDVWGIGTRLKEKLYSSGVKTAFDLTKKTDSWIRSQMSVVGLRTVYELRGTCCLKLSEIAPQKSILRSRTFTPEIGTLSALEEKISLFAEAIGRHLRKHGLVCEGLCTFAASNRHRQTSKYVSNSCHLHFSEPTAYTPHLIRKAKEGLKQIFQQGILYKRVGVLVYGLTGGDARARDLFAPKPINESKQANLMAAYDKIHTHYGKKALYFAAQGSPEAFFSDGICQSGAYTTSWDELLKVSL